MGSNLWSWQRAQVTVNPIRPRVTTSMRSSMMSWSLLLKRRPTVRKPIAASADLSRLRGPGLAKLIGGELLADELIVGQVVVEGRDHVVAIGVGIRIAAVLGEDVALGVGVAGHVEPVPAPALAVGGRGQQAIDHLGVGVGRGVVFERFDLVGRGRQAGQVECRAAQQRAPIGPRRGTQFVVFQPRENEAIDRAGGPVCVLDWRRIGKPHGP